MDTKHGWGFQDPNEEDYEIEEIENIDHEIEAFQRHLNNQCDPLFCSYCPVEG